MFTGLSAFPLTPVTNDGIDEAAFVKLIKRLVEARVDSIGALGSTGSYAYLTRTERERVAKLAIDNADGVPVMIGIGAVATRDTLLLAEDAQRAGAAAVLLAPVSYQRLSDEEVFGLYEAVTRNLSVPLCVYDNPGTTHFEFSDDLHGRIARLPQVRSIKIPGVPDDPTEAKARVERLRGKIPESVTIGVSGDWFAATGLSAGCDAWYSVIGGLFPALALAITRAAQAKDIEKASRLSSELTPFWNLFKQHGSLRVMATAAALLGLVTEPCLPMPLRGLDEETTRKISTILQELEMH